MSQSLDQIHAAASQSETLTTFNDFTPAPSSSSGREGKGLAGELQGGLSGLYNRFRASVGGVTNLVGGVATGEDKEISEDKVISRPESNVQLVKDKLGVGKVQASAVTSPTATAELTPKARVQSSTSLSNTISSDQIQLTRGSRSSTSTAVVSPKVSGTYSQSGGSNPGLVPLTKATTSSAANPKLAEVHLVAVQDASLLGKPEADRWSGMHQQVSSPSEISTLPGDEGALSISMRSVRSHAKSDSEDQQTSVPTIASIQLSRHERNSTQASESELSAGSDNSPPAMNQDEVLIHSASSRGASEGNGTLEKVVSFTRTGPISVYRAHASRDISLEYQGLRNNKSLDIDTLIPSPIQVETHRQTPLAKDPVDANTNDVANMGLAESSPLESRLKSPQSDDHTAAAAPVSRSHLPGFTISHASSSDNDLPSPLVSANLPNLIDQRTVTGNKPRALGRRPTDLPVPSNEHPSVSGSIVSSQTRSKVLSKDYWMKDENAQDCFYCGDAFSTFRRKHHCRKCHQE